MFEMVDEADDYDAGTRPLKYMRLTALGRCLESLVFSAQVLNAACGHAITIKASIALRTRS
jgi:hypothetical protein